MRLSVVIVSYNVRYYLEQCLRSVFRSGVTGGMEVFVVDNNSSDHSIDYLRPLFPEVTYMQNRDNVGFSRANNQAIRQARGEYILLLNPDTILTEHTLEDCLSFLDAHPDAGATGVAMYSHNGRFAWESRRGLPTPWTSFCKMSGLGSLLPHSRTFGHYYMRYLPRLQTSRIEVISGAFCMVRHEALRQVGLLDEDFFMYGEDIDLSYRLLKGGWANYYLPTPILHYKGESTQRSSYRYVHIFYEAMLIFFHKHYSRQYRFFSLLIPLAVRLRAAIDLAQRALTRPSRGKKRVINMDDYQIRQFGTLTYDEMLLERISAYERGDRHSLGIHYPESGITVLPYDILTRENS
ncbi:MAG: glycosyltransferase family 2 protein [Prevotellaceae bacterium]|nr:glycosyltransferase family 2 protein [Prevotellaceae bacterium]